MLLLQTIYNLHLLRSMLDHAFNQNKRNFSSSLEITETEINHQMLGKAGIYSYPRHIPQLPTRKSRTALTHQNRALPLTCQLAISVTEAREKLDTNFNLWQVKSDRHKIKQLHLDNMRQNLERRLQTAQANQDHKLLALLKIEFQQLETTV